MRVILPRVRAAHRITKHNAGRLDEAVQRLRVIARIHVDTNLRVLTDGPAESRGGKRLAALANLLAVVRLEGENGTE